MAARSLDAELKNADHVLVTSAEVMRVCAEIELPEHPGSFQSSSEKKRRVVARACLDVATAIVAPDAVDDAGLLLCDENLAEIDNAVLFTAPPDAPTRTTKYTVPPRVYRVASKTTSPERRLCVPKAFWN